MPGGNSAASICEGGKVTFAKGAHLEDITPSKLFNSSLERNARRAIDLQKATKLTTPPSRLSSATQWR